MASVSFVVGIASPVELLLGHLLSQLGPEYRCCLLWEMSLERDEGYTLCYRQVMVESLNTYLKRQIEVVIFVFKKYGVTNHGLGVF